MTTDRYEEARAECLKSKYIKVDKDGFEYCPLRGKEYACNGYRCPVTHSDSKTRTEKPAGYYKWKALEKAGLKEQYEKEIGGVIV